MMLAYVASSCVRQVVCIVGLGNLFDLPCIVKKSICVLWDLVVSRLATLIYCIWQRGSYRPIHWVELGKDLIKRQAVKVNS